MKPHRHLLSLTSSLWVIFNLGFWMWPIFVLALVKLLFGRIASVNQSCNTLLNWIYRTAVRINSFWMLKVVGIDIEIDGELPDHPSPIVVVNHQSWFDIPVVHYIVSANGPVLKFLIKKNLVWVPIVGWICYALNFPRLDRSGSDAARRRDLAAIKSASRAIGNEQGALLIYAEGTRFTEEKHKNQASPYRHLLIPKPGGLKIALGNVDAETPVIDMTIAYTGGDTHFWRCLGGATRHIKVTMRNHPAGEITDARDWLQQRWQEKDALLS